MKVLYQAEVNITSGKLNVRSAAGTKAAVIGKLRNGETVDVIADESGWAHIMTDDLDGWCSKDYLVQSEAEDEPLASTTIVITDSEGNAFYPVGEFTVKVAND